jgi:hypothetical protein
MNTIVYASYFEPLTVCIQQLCQVEDIAIKAFNHQVNEFTEVVLVSTPVQVEDQFWDVSRLWLNYLKQTAPQVKLIVLGLDPFESVNYIDCIKPLPSLKSLIDNASKVSDGIALPKGLNPGLDHLL